MSSKQTPKDQAEQVQAEAPSQELEDSQLKAVVGGSSDSTIDADHPFQGGNHQKPQQPD